MWPCPNEGEYHRSGRQDSAEAIPGFCARLRRLESPHSPGQQVDRECEKCGGAACRRKLRRRRQLEKRAEVMPVGRRSVRPQVDDDRRTNHEYERSHCRRHKNDNRVYPVRPATYFTRCPRSPHSEASLEISRATSRELGVDDESREGAKGALRPRGGPLT